MNLKIILLSLLLVGLYGRADAGSDFSLTPEKAETAKLVEIKRRVYSLSVVLTDSAFRELQQLAMENQSKVVSIRINGVAVTRFLVNERFLNLAKDDPYNAFKHLRIPIMKRQEGESYLRYLTAGK